HADPVGDAPVTHSLRDLDSPADAALDARRAHVLTSARVFIARALVAEHLERCLISRAQRLFLEREKAGQRRVRGCDDRCPARGAVRSPTLDEYRRIAPVDPGVRLKDGRVNDSAEPLTGRVRRSLRNERLVEDLIPLEYVVDAGQLWRLLRSDTQRVTTKGQRDQHAEPTDFVAVALHKSPDALRPFFAGSSGRRSTIAATQPRASAQDAIRRRGYKSLQIGRAHVCT